MRRNPPAKWALPETVNPATRRCIQVQVPDDPMHIAAFRGAMLALASAYNWTDDAAHKAKDVALVWRGIIDSMTTWGCEVPVMFRACSSPGCGLEYSTDGGTTWHCIDLAPCIETIWDEKLAQAFDDGVLGGPSSGQGPGAPSPNVCYDFNVELPANSAWLCPISVDAGDIVTLTHVQGTWTDYQGISNWYCIDGRTFTINSCNEHTTTDAGDPMPTVAHMRLIANVGGSWYEVLDTPLAIPSGISGGQLMLQANDAVLSDNMGSARFHVRVCKSVCANLDFRVGLGGATIPLDDSNNPRGTFTPGTGIVGKAFLSLGVQYDGAVVYDIPGAGTYHSISIHIHVDSLGGFNTGNITWGGLNQNFSWSGTGDFTFTYTGTWNSGSIILQAYSSYQGTGGSVTIVGIDLCE